MVNVVNKHLLSPHKNKKNENTKIEIFAKSVKIKCAFVVKVNEAISHLSDVVLYQ